MAAYIVRRLLLMIPTLLGIMIINFAVIQFLPGGPVEQVLAELSGQATGATDRFTGGTGSDFQGANLSQGGAGGAVNSKYRGAQGLDPDFIKELEAQFGFDKPTHVRFFIMLKNYAVFDFGESYFKDRTVMSLVIDKLPVSISLGLWTTLIAYLISIPLGIRKAVQDGTRFDIWTSGVIIIGYAIPSFVLAVFLLVLFAGGSFMDIFPNRGLYSDNWDSLSVFGKIRDYAWHMALPVSAMVVGAFATLTLLTKNSFLDEINKQYVLTARAKGLTEARVLYGHVFRNAMLIVIAGFPAAFLSILFTGNLLIETIFSLDGLGLLAYEAAINRDYPVMLGTLYFFSLIGLLMHLMTDLVYTLIDPRIDFEARDA
jgi:microcin C transport system permease protein